MIVYKATCSVTNKVYIGITKKTLEQRKSRHEALARQGRKEHFRLALVKHGFDSFKWEVIDKAETWEELCELEKDYIEKYDSYNKGYNSTLGGDGAFGVTWTEERKEAHKKALEEYHPLRGKKLTEEVKKKISKANKGKERTEKSNIKRSEKLTGIKRSKETRKKMGDCQIGEKNHNAKLTAEKVLEIKSLFSKGVKQRDISSMFGVGSSTIRAIKQGTRWADVKLPSEI